MRTLHPISSCCAINNFLDFSWLESNARVCHDAKRIFDNSSRTRYPVVEYMRLDLHVRVAVSSCVASSSFLAMEMCYQHT